MQRVPPTVRVALVEVTVTQSWLELLPQAAYSHLQDVGFLQLGTGLLLEKLFLLMGSLRIFSTIGFLSCGKRDT